LLLLLLTLTLTSWRALLDFLLTASQDCCLLHQRTVPQPARGHAAFCIELAWLICALSR